MNLAKLLGTASLLTFIMFSTEALAKTSPSSASSALELEKNFELAKAKKKKLTKKQRAALLAKKRQAAEQRKQLEAMAVAAATAAVEQKIEKEKQKIYQYINHIIVDKEREYEETITELGHELDVLGEQIKNIKNNVSSTPPAVEAHSLQQSSSNLPATSETHISSPPAAGLPPIAKLQAVPHVKDDLATNGDAASGGLLVPHSTAGVVALPHVKEPQQTASSQETPNEGTGSSQSLLDQIKNFDKTKLNKAAKEQQQIDPSQTEDLAVPEGPTSNQDILGSIKNFDKSRLKHVDTSEKSVSQDHSSLDDALRQGLAKIRKDIADNDSDDKIADKKSNDSDDW